jgi:predicted PurR-regulated permease PerM
LASSATGEAGTDLETLEQGELMSQSVVLWRGLLATLLVAIALAAAGLLVVSLQIVLLTFAGLLFGIFLNGVARWFQAKTPLSYQWSYALVVLLLATLVGGGFYLLHAQIAEKADMLQSQLQSAWQLFQKQVEQSPRVQRFLPEAGQLREMFFSSGGGASRLLTGVWWVLWGVTGLLVIVFVGLYAAYDPDLYRAGIVKLVPPAERPRALEILQHLTTALGRWIIGRMISMSIVGILTAIGLRLFGVPLPVTLGVIAALLTFIPNIGPVLAAIPQALLALQVGPSTALYVILFNIGLQTVESYVLTPIVERYEVTLPPVLTVFAQLLMGVLLGVIGVIMAAPVVLVQALYIRDQLGDPSPGELIEGT